MRKAAGLTMFLCSLLFILEAPDANEPGAKQLDPLFAAINSSNAPGAAVIVLKDGHKIFERGYGVTDLRTLHRIDEHTNFRLASLNRRRGPWFGKPCRLGPNGAQPVRSEEPRAAANLYSKGR